MVEKTNFDNALDRANKIPSKTRKIHNLVFIAQNLSNTGYSEKCVRTFNLAIQKALDYDNGRMKSEELTFIANVLLDMEMFEMILDIIPNIDQQDKKVSVIDNMIVKLSRSSYEHKIVIYDELIGMTEGLNHRTLTQEVFIKKIASNLARNNLIDKTIELSNRIDTRSLRDEVLKITTSALLYSKEFDKALKIAENINSPINRVKAFNEISTSLLAYNKDNQAKMIMLKTFDEIKSNLNDFGYNFESLRDIAFSLAIIGEFFKAVSLIRFSKIHFNSKRTAYEMLSLIMSEKGYKTESQELLKILSICVSQNIT